MAAKREFRSFEEYLIERLQDPDEAAIYLEVVLDEYAEDRDLAGLFYSLHLLAKAQGDIVDILEKAGIDKQFLDDILSKKADLEHASIGTILKNLG